MPLTKVNGVYRTPGGCSAWNGRTFTGAAADVKCGAGAILFRRSGWYVAKNIGFHEMFYWFEGKEDPGCAWNASSSGFKSLWKSTSDADFEAMLWDQRWDSVSGVWQPTYARPTEDWFEPCPEPDDTGEENF